jgi:hypothetical protein
MTSDERNLLLLLAKMVLTDFPQPDEYLRAAINRLEDDESRIRDEFVAKIMKGSE